MFDLTPEETKIYQKLNTPQKIQNFLDQMPRNFRRETLYSPRQVLRHHRAHCIEGALFAASVLWSHGHKPLLLDIVAHDTDFDHVVALFKQDDCWGAISKSNHSVLRWRDPVYQSVRELAISYFHEYFLPDGRKSMETFSAPFDLRKYGTKWITSENNLWKLGNALDNSKHFRAYPKTAKKYLRRADRIEIEAGKLVEWRGQKKML